MKRIIMAVFLALLLALGVSPIALAQEGLAESYYIEDYSADEEYPADEDLLRDALEVRYAAVIPHLNQDDVESLLTGNYDVLITSVTSQYCPVLVFVIRNTAPGNLTVGLSVSTFMISIAGILKFLNTSE